MKFVGEIKILQALYTVSVQQRLNRLFCHVYWLEVGLTYPASVKTLTIALGTCNSV